MLCLKNVEFEAVPASFKAGVSKLRPASQIRPTKSFLIVKKEYFIFRKFVDLLEP